MTSVEHPKTIHEVAIQAEDEGNVMDFDTAAAEAAETEDHPIAPREDFVKKAHVRSREQYEAMYKKSIEDPEGFWGEIANQFYWHKKWDVSITLCQLTVSCSEYFEVNYRSIFFFH